MPSILVSVISFALGSFALRFFSALGIGFFVYSGLTSLIENMLTLVESNFSGLPVSVLNILSLIGLSDALSILGSALLTRAALQSARTFIGAKK